MWEVFEHEYAYHKLTVMITYCYLDSETSNLTFKTKSRLDVVEVPSYTVL